MRGAGRIKENGRLKTIKRTLYILVSDVEVAKQHRALLPQANNAKSHHYNGPSPIRLTGNNTMCKAKIHGSPTCNHYWATLESPCAKDRNFSNCPSFHGGLFRPARDLRTGLAKPKSCPECDKVQYDGKLWFPILEGTNV